MNSKTAWIGNPRWNLLLLVVWLVGVFPSFAAGDDTDDLYRFTVFPWYKISDQFTAYAHLGYSVDPGKDSRTFNFVSPGVYYSPTPWLQVWEGMINRYVHNANGPDQLELRPFGGVKLFVPNDWKINFYDFFRYEYRAIEDRETHEWQGSSRIATGSAPRCLLRVERTRGSQRPFMR